jgi:hypothetical protein
MRRALYLGLALWALPAHAQPVTEPDAVPPLAQIRDDKELAQALATITQDPAVRVNDPKARPLAAALMTEGVRQLQALHHEQALANFLEAYSKFPSPKILLNIGSTLRDMGRLADAANTYQRYLADPATGPERIEEVKQLLVDLDQQLTLLTIRVTPRGSEVSIDGGPWLPVGSTLQTRVRPGIHLVRVRHAGTTSEVTINGFEGESKDVPVTVSAPASPAPAETAPPPPPATTEAVPPEQTAEKVDGWLITGTQYATSDGAGSERRVRSGYAGPELRAIVPRYEVEDDGSVSVERPDERRIRSGVLGLVRVDGKGRGVAGGLGLALSPLDSVELEVAGLKADHWGLYAGIRVRLLTGWLRPYLAGGVPLFFFTDETTMDSAVALGLRGAGGAEVKLNGHLSVQVDVGIEHFFNVKDALVDGKRPDETVFVPTVGVIGRL